MNNCISFAIFACAAFAAGTGLVGSSVSADEPEAEAIQFKLTKLVYQRAQRSTFWLEIISEQKALSVRATCDLRKDGMGVGRFPLERVASNEDPEVQRFRISCLHDDFIEDTIIHVLVRDESTGKSVDGARIRLKDAEPKADN